jgi:hypothetical protein
MTFRIPTNGQFSQPNQGDTSGNLNRTVNFDLKTNPGRMRISSRITVNTKDNDSGISGMGVPQAFVNHVKTSTHQYYAACGIGNQSADGSGRILVSATDDPTALFTNDTSTGSPTDVSAAFSDMVEWTDAKNNGTNLGPSIFVSTYSSSNSQIKKLFNSTWNTTWFTGTAGGTLVGGGIKNMCVGFNSNLYIIDDDKIVYVPFSTSGLAPTAVTSGSGTLNFYGAYRPIWIRTTATYLVIGLMTYDAASGTKGLVALWDGTGTAPQKTIDIAAPCAPSCTIIEDVPFIIDAFGILKKYDSTGFTEVARLPVANQNIEMPGIYNSSTNSRWIHHRGMDIVDGKININVNNFVSTGVYVEDMPSGIWEYDPRNASQGLYHKGSPCASSTDWGQQLINTAGAIYGTKRSTATYLAGYSYYTDSGSTSRNGIFYDDIVTNSNKRAMVTTPWLTAEGKEDSYNEVGYRFKQFPSGDKIIGKYRSYKKSNLPIVANATWVTTSQFTSTDNNFQYASVGDEVEAVMGVGASTTAHISSMTNISGTYTINLDDTIGQSSGSSKVKVNNFIKMGTLSDQNVSDGQLIPAISSMDTQLQVKTELRGTGDFELNDITIINTPHK